MLWVGGNSETAEPQDRRTASNRTARPQDKTKDRTCLVDRAGPHPTRLQLPAHQRRCYGGLDVPACLNTKGTIMSQENQYAANAKTITPRPKEDIPKGYVGPLLPFGNGFTPCKTGNGVYCLVETPEGATGMLFCFGADQQAEAEIALAEQKAGNKFSCVIAGKRGDTWNDMATVCSVDEDGRAFAF